MGPIGSQSVKGRDHDPSDPDGEGCEEVREQESGGADLPSLLVESVVGERAGVAEHGAEDEGVREAEVEDGQVPFGVLGFDCVGGWRKLCRRHVSDCCLGLEEARRT